MNRDKLEALIRNTAVLTSQLMSGNYSLETSLSLSPPLSISSPYFSYPFYPQKTFYQNCLSTSATRHGKSVTSEYSIFSTLNIDMELHCLNTCTILLQPLPYYYYLYPLLLVLIINVVLFTSYLHFRIVTDT